MDGPRAVKKEEMKMLEGLANEVFRSYENAPKTMFQEYADLYNENNIDNLRVIAEDGKIVANINYLPHVLAIYSSRINMATLGGVGTLKDYRGRGYGTLLLNDCINRMKEQGIELLHISGDRFMYRNAGSVPAGSIFNFDIGKNDQYESQVIGDNGVRDKGTEIQEYGDADFDLLVRLYMNESVRYIRPYDRFKILLKGKKFMHLQSIERKTVLIRRGGFVSGYVIFTIENSHASIIDCAGPKQMIIKACGKIIEKYKLKGISGFILNHERDAIDYCGNNGITLETSRLSGTIKIIDFEKLMNHLRPYFYEVYDNQFVDDLTFKYKDGEAAFLYKNNECAIHDNYKLNDLIFGGQAVYKNDFKVTGDFDVFDEFFSRVFPLPFVNTGGLSYV